MLTKISDNTIRTFDEAEQLYPNNFILLLRTEKDKGVIVAICTGSEVNLFDYGMMLYEEMNPLPLKNPYVIAYGMNIDSSIGGVYLEA